MSTEATVVSGGAPAVTPGVSAAVEHGTEAELEQFLLGGDKPGGQAVEDEAEGDAPDADGDGESDEVEIEGDADEGDTEEHDEHDEHEDLKNLPKGVQKRINKLTALRREAEEARDAAVAERQRAADELAQMRAQLDAAAVDAGARSGVSRLAAMQSEQQLEEHAGKLMRLKGLLMENSDGYESEDGNIDLSAADVKQKLLAIDRELMVDYPKAVRLMSQRQQSNQAAAAVYPDLFDKGGQNAATLQSALLALPGLAAMPNAAFIVGDMLAGERLRAAGLRLTEDGKVVRVKAAAAAAAPARTATAGKPTAKAKAPAVAQRAAAPRLAPPSVGGGGAASVTGGSGKDKWARVQDEGSEEALMAALMG